MQSVNTAPRAQRRVENGSGGANRDIQRLRLHTEMFTAALLIIMKN